MNISIPKSQEPIFDGQVFCIVNNERVPFTGTWYEERMVFEIPTGTHYTIKSQRELSKLSQSSPMSQTSQMNCRYGTITKQQYLEQRPCYGVKVICKHPELIFADGKPFTASDKKQCETCTLRQDYNIETQIKTQKEKKMFDYVFCVSLKQRQDRREQLEKQLEDCHWKLPIPEYFQAVDGKQVKPPKYWEAGEGAWGCYRSHLLVLEKALNEGMESYLLLEDDAVIPTDFNEQFARFQENVPDDWEFVFLGGQHLYQRKGLPNTVADGVNKPFHPHRGHAYGLRGPKVMQDLYNFLFQLPFDNPKNHLDHQFGIFVENGHCNCYAADPFLIGQSDGQSNINGKTLGTRFWNISKRTGGKPYLFDTNLFHVKKATTGFGSLALNELGYDPGLDLPDGYNPLDWQILSAHCASSITVTIKQPVTLIGCLNGSSHWHSMSPVKFDVSKNTAGYLFGPLDITEPIKLPPGEYELTTQSNEPSWAHCLWLVQKKN